MPRPVTTTTRRALTAQYSADAFVDLVTLSSVQMEVPVRLANSAVDVTSRGLLFSRSKMDVVRPDSTGDTPPSATITLLGVDRTVTDALRPLTEPIDVVIEAVRQAAPDVVEQRISGIRIFGVTCTESTVQAALGIEDPRTKTAPAHAFIWAHYSGIQ
jgi:hypothetical protein